MEAGKLSYEELVNQVASLREQVVGLSTLVNELQDESRMSAEKVFDAARALFIKIDLQGRILYFNHAAELLTGYRSGEITGKYLSDLFEIAPASQNVITEKQARFINELPDRWECRVRAKAGREHFVVFISHNQAGNKDVSSRSFLGLDITEIKKHENDQIFKSESAFEKALLNSVLIEDVSHKIRTSLNAIVGFSNLLTNPKLDIEQINSFAQIVANSSNELLGILNELLTYNSLESEKETVAVQEVSLNALLDELKTKFAVQVKSKELEFRLAKGLSNKDSEILTDRFKVLQVLTNLLANSLKFTDRGSIEVGYRLLNDEIEFFVKDTGVGIDNRLMERLLNSHSKSEALPVEDGGLGLGLTVTRRVIGLLGGVFKVESQLGVGSTFSFTIPYTPAHLETRTPGTKRAEKETITVLVAEDEEINYLLLKTLLDKGNVRVIRAKNGKEAYERYKQNPNINLILMDIHMPEVDGYQAAQLIKNEAPEIPIIAQSAYVYGGERAQYGKTFDDFLFKPIDQTELKIVVNKFVDGAFLN